MEVAAPLARRAVGPDAARRGDRVRDGLVPSIDPPAGRLRALPGPRAGNGQLEGREFGFAGWLGLLRALYEVTASPAGGAPAGP